MYMCIHIYLYICIHICTYVHLYIYKMHASLCTFAYIYMICAQKDRQISTDTLGEAKGKSKCSSGESIRRL